MRRLTLLLLLVLLACSGELGPPAGPNAMTAPSELLARPLGGGVHLSWRDNSAAESSFEIERADRGDFAKIGTVVFDVTQLHDATVRPGIRYRYRVRAVGDPGASPYSEEAVVELPAVEPKEDAGVLEADSGAEAPDAASASDAGVEPSDAGVEPSDAGAATRDAGASPSDAGARDSGVRPDAGGSDAGAPSFQREIVPIFVASCGANNNACHSRIAYFGNVGQSCRGWLALEDLPLGSRDPNNNNPTGCPDRSLYQRLTELTAWMCSPEVPYVRGGALGASQLYAVISGNSARGGNCNRAPSIPLGPMPPPSSTYVLPPESAAKISAWISAGAPNN